MKYSFVLMLISPTSLATKSKFQKNICFKTRAVGLINIKTKECKSGRHLCKWSIGLSIMSISSFYVNLFEMKRCKLINMNFGALVVKF